MKILKIYFPKNLKLFNTKFIQITVVRQNVTKCDKMTYYYLRYYYC